MIDRKILAELQLLLTEYPIVTLLGPRQAGKTTLARHFLKDFSYSNLERPDIRRFASEDPLAYLSNLRRPVIIDEIQRVPELLSYIQVLVDEDDQCGQFILTGSHQLHLHEAVTQSLAGRTAILNLLPLSIVELAESGIVFDTFEQYCYNGFLPRVYAKSMRAEKVYANYYKTYVERDVRLLINLRNISLFEKMLHLLAGRVGQILNYSSLANDVGVDIKTIKQWLSILESSFVIYKLAPFYENFGKRVIKAPKYYFIDTGLLVFLLGIRQPEQITRDPLVGSIFENLVVIEILKQRYNSGFTADIYFFRDSHGNEVDLLIPDHPNFVACEIKSAKTYNSKMFNPIKKLAKLTDKAVLASLIYSGESMAVGDNFKCLNFKNIATSLF